MIKTSIIIVTYNRINDTIDCINSIIANIDIKDKELIVVDNKSSDNTIKILKNKYPSIISIENEKNLGFGKANNVGVRKAKGEYLIFLNNDTIVNNESFDSLINILSSTSDRILVGGKVLNTDNSPQINAGRELTIINSLIKWGIHKIVNFKIPLFKNYWIKTWGKEEVQEVDRLSGCFFALRKEYFNEIGGFDENYFMYYEDADLCRRFKDNGGKIIYHPFSNIIHLKGKSSSSFEKGDIIIEEFKSLNYYLIKFYGIRKTKLFYLILRIIWNIIWITLLILKIISFNKSEKFKEKFIDIKFYKNNLILNKL